MSLARAFTTRMGKRENTSTPPPIRTGSVRASVKAVNRNLISPPVALLSTTNMLSYNAPDIKTLRKASSSISSSSSKGSADDSDGSSPGSRSRDTYSTDASSVETSPTTSPGNNPSNSYFQSKTNQRPRRSISTSDLRTRSTSNSPEIPQRAPSHSKRAHEQLARKRSLQQFPSHSSIQSMHSATNAPSREQRVSPDTFSSKVDSTHPFGRELEQLDEVAEEFNGAVRDVDREADLAVMKTKNLGKFIADDYIKEIAPLFTKCFEPRMIAVGGGDGGGGWI